MIETIVSAIILCNNFNYTYSERCMQPVAEMTVTPTGDFYGTLTNGIPWSQTRITPSLQLFQMENVKWITNGETIIYLD